MSDPICYANPSLSPAALSATQRIAELSFRERRPIQSGEMLWPNTLAARYVSIVGNPALRPLRFPIASEYLMDPIARRVVDAMNVAPEVDQRTYTNVSRLFNSDRVSTEQIVSLLTALANHNNAEFNGLAHRMFLNAGLFYFVNLDAQNTVTCFIDR